MTLGNSVLTHSVDTSRVGLCLVWGTFGRCSRVMEGGIEIRVLDGTNTGSLICPGHEVLMGRCYSKPIKIST
jgi:hypothetical protein